MRTGCTPCGASRRPGRPVAQRIPEGRARGIAGSSAIITTGITGTPRRSPTPSTTPFSGSSRGSRRCTPELSDPSSYAAGGERSRSPRSGLSYATCRCSPSRTPSPKTNSTNSTRAFGGSSPDAAFPGSRWNARGDLAEVKIDGLAVELTYEGEGIPVEPHGRRRAGRNCDRRNLRTIPDVPFPVPRAGEAYRSSPGPSRGARGSVHGAAAHSALNRGRERAGALRRSPSRGSVRQLDPKGHAQWLIEKLRDLDAPDGSRARFSSHWLGFPSTGTAAGSVEPKSSRSTGEMGSKKGSGRSRTRLTGSW